MLKALNDKKLYGIALIGIFSFFLFIRLFHILADPPVSLSKSGGLFFDEGANVQNARNKVLFGEWKFDDWNNMYYSPLLNYVHYAVFSIWGVGLLQERIVGVAFSFLALIFFYSAFRASFTKWEALLGTTLLGCNYFFLMYNRVGLYETPLAAVMVVTFYFWQKSETKRKPFTFFLLGVSCFTVFIFKNIALYFLVAVALAFLWRFVALETEGSWRPRFRVSFWFGCGVAFVFVLWLLLFYLPNRDEVRAIGQSWSRLAMPRNFDALLKNILREPLFSYFWLTPVIFTTAFLFAAITCYRLLEAPREVPSADLFVLFWLLFGIGGLSILSYRPDRYYIPMVPPMCYLSARFFGFLLKGVEFSKAKALGASSHFVTFVWSTLIFLYLVFPFLNVLYPDLKALRLSAESYLVLSILVSVALLGGIVLLMKTSWIGEKWRVPVSFTRILALILLAVFFYNNGKNYLAWARAPEYQIVTVSRELGAILKPRSYIAGLAAAVLSLETDHRVLYAFRGWFNDTPDLFERYPVTHLLVADYNTELDWYRKSYPGIMRNAHLLKTYHIWRSNFFLYEVNR